MAAATMTKVTSLGSQSDGGPSVPNPTPATEALDDEVVTAPPPMDFAAVTRILAPITESLNESAEEAMYPSPPINTPIIGSPTPSMVCRPLVRGRGFSLIGDRLAQLKLDDRKTHVHRHHRGTDVTTSNHSVAPSGTDDCEDCDMASISEVMSDGCKGKECPGHACMSTSLPHLSLLGTGSVPIALGSPAINPRIEEYLSFTSNDLPNQAPSPATGTTLAEHASSTSAAAMDVKSSHSRASILSDGVTEKSNWADEVEETFEHTCLRLEQLARDEHNADPGKSIEEYYLARIARLLAGSKRSIPVKITKPSKA
jgi:hypothetical protein